MIEHCGQRAGSLVISRPSRTRSQVQHGAPHRSTSNILWYRNASSSRARLCSRHYHVQNLIFLFPFHVALPLSRTMSDDEVIDPKKIMAAKVTDRECKPALKAYKVRQSTPFV